MLSSEAFVDEIRFLENLFADRMAADAEGKELTEIFIQIKMLKEQLKITCHSQLADD